VPLRRARAGTAPKRVELNERALDRVSSYRLRAGREYLMRLASAHALRRARGTAPAESSLTIARSIVSSYRLRAGREYLMRLARARAPTPREGRHRAQTSRT
jgi:hypothetical protein